MPKKKGRRPKDYKPPFCQTLQIKEGNFIIIFDENCEGDLKDLLHGKGKSVK